MSLEMIHTILGINSFFESMTEPLLSKPSHRICIRHLACSKVLCPHTKLLRRLYMVNKHCRLTFAVGQTETNTAVSKMYAYMRQKKICSSTFQNMLMKTKFVLPNK